MSGPRGVPEEKLLGAGSEGLQRASLWTAHSPSARARGFRAERAALAILLCLRSPRRASGSRRRVLGEGRHDAELRMHASRETGRKGLGRDRRALRISDRSRPCVANEKGRGSELDLPMRLRDDACGPPQESEARGHEVLWVPQAPKRDRTEPAATGSRRRAFRPAHHSGGRREKARCAVLGLHMRLRSPDPRSQLVADDGTDTILRLPSPHRACSSELPVRFPATLGSTGWLCGLHRATRRARCHAARNDGGDTLQDARCEVWTG